MSSTARESIEIIENRSPDRNYLIELECPEFTCRCPRTGQPDFATILVRYIPEQKCVELKSLKLYLWSFRDRGVFHEDVVNEIGDHLRSVLCPRYLQVVGDFNIRGGIHARMEVSWGSLPEGRCLNPRT